ncbi:hypothetical protein ABW19_dt0203301 [Dactylella cylindrospora]|nr:hypothetical protein ABW19_dt0203301 [Dactylella cylindrospora]
MMLRYGGLKKEGLLPMEYYPPRYASPRKSKPTFNTLPYIRLPSSYSPSYAPFIHGNYCLVPSSITRDKEKPHEEREKRHPLVRGAYHKILELNYRRQAFPVHPPPSFSPPSPSPQHAHA